MSYCARVHVCLSFYQDVLLFTYISHIYLNNNIKNDTKPKAIDTKSKVNNETNANKVKKSAIKEIVKEKKPKKNIPLRAKNDPRQKS